MKRNWAGGPVVLVVILNWASNDGLASCAVIGALVWIFGAIAPLAAGDVPKAVELKAESVGVHDWAPFTIASDGSIWTDIHHQGLRRFDGKQWAPVPGAEEVHELRYILAGQGGSMLLQDERGHMLITPHGVWKEEDLKVLIQSRREDFVAAFPRMGLGLSRPVPRIVADKAGNIWLQPPGESDCYVLVGEQWVPMQPIVERAGMARRSLCVLDSVGDGSQVYLTDLSPKEDAKTSFLAEVVKNEIVLRPVPHIMHLPMVQCPLLDQEGALWLSAIRHEGGGGIAGTLACRVGEKGEIEQINDMGWATLCDKGGNVWLHDRIGRPPQLNFSQLNIWRKGKIVCSLPWGRGVDFMFSDKPNSVYIRTGNDLRHLICNDAEKADYRLRECFTLTGLEDPIGLTVYSSLGYLVFTADADLLFYVALP